MDFRIYLNFHNFDRKLVRLIVYWLHVYSNSKHNLGNFAWIIFFKYLIDPENINGKSNTTTSQERGHMTRKKQSRVLVGSGFYVTSHFFERSRNSRKRWVMDRNGRRSAISGLFCAFVGANTYQERFPTKREKT